MPRNEIFHAPRSHLFFIRQDDSETVPAHPIQVLDGTMFIEKRVFRSCF